MTETVFEPQQTSFLIACLALHTLTPLQCGPWLPRLGDGKEKSENRDHCRAERQRLRLYPRHQFTTRIGLSVSRRHMDAPRKDPSSEAAGAHDALREARLLLTALEGQLTTGGTRVADRISAAVTTACTPLRSVLQEVSVETLSVTAVSGWLGAGQKVWEARCSRVGCEFQAVIPLCTMAPPGDDRGDVLVSAANEPWHAESAGDDARGSVHASILLYRGRHVRSRKTVPTPSWSPWRARGSLHQVPEGATRRAQCLCHEECGPGLPYG